MMRVLTLPYYIISYLSYITPTHSQSTLLNVDLIMNQISTQLKHRFDNNQPADGYPHSYNVGQSVVTVNSSDWTSGFFPGILWYTYEYTKNPTWKKHAEDWTAGLEGEKNNTTTHDLGFILYTSFGNGYRLTQNAKYKSILLKGAKSLASRYNPNVGCIRSWEHGDWKYPVIIDNMMNLELLFWASKNSVDKSFYKIAVSHANNTLKNHFRKNGSSYHVVDYDSKTGKVISRTTAQGYANESAWARGQAWGLYGFTMTFRETHEKVFLEQAEKIAHYYIENLPRNRIPYWDFDAPNIPFEFQDASAAAIAASALIELSQYSEKSGKFYLNAAKEILETLSSPSFFAKEKTNGNFILTHSVGNLPKNIEVNAPLIYSDYYFQEALLRYRKLSQNGDSK